jgi:GT2 family glycosyltransferase
VVEPLAGLDFARNRALATAGGDVVAFLDDDVVADLGWFAALHEVWAVHPDAGGATGQVLPYQLETSAQVAFELYGGFRRPWAPARYTLAGLPGNPLFPYGAGMFGAGCNMSYRRRAVLDLGGFDEALDTGRPLPGGGDLDMFSRVIRGGHPLVYSPSYLVHHQHRRTQKELRRQFYTWGTGHMAYVEKTWRTDPAGRLTLVRLVLWQLRRLVRDTVRSVRGRSEVSYRLSLSELVGSLVGLTGSYARSVRRSSAIRSAAGA